MIDWRISAGTVVNRWVRNINWIPITTPADNEEKVIILRAVFDGTQEWTALSAAGDYTVDWGDGNIENYTSGVTAEHTYNYADVDLYDSSTELGYKQALIQIYPQIGQNLTTLNLHIKHSEANATSLYDSCFLDLCVVSVNLTTILLGTAVSTTETYTINHNKLEQVSIYAPDLSVGGGLFTSLKSLENIKRLEIGSPTNLFRFAFNTPALKSVIPFIDLTNCTNLDAFFRGSTTVGVQSVLTIPACTTLFAFSGNNFNLQSFPKVVNSANVTDWSYFFDSNMFTEFQSDLDTSGGLIFDFFFYATKIKNPPLFDTSKATSIKNKFFNSLVTDLPLYDYSKVVYANSAFKNSLITVLPNYDFSSCQDFNAMLQGVTGLRATGVINAAAGTVFTNIYNGCGNLEYSILQGCRYTVSIANCRFPKVNLEAFIAALGSAATGTQTLTISGNPGTGTITSLSGTTTVGSKTVAFANTTGIVVGDRMTGTGSPLTTPITVSFQDAGDTVTINNHQLPLNHPVSFVTVVTTTGIVVRTIYYVSDPTANTFQLAATPNGVALPLTTNGTGTIIYDATVESIDTNVSVTLTAPATSTSTSSKSFRALNTAPAVLHGFTISG